MDDIDYSKKPDDQDERSDLPTCSRHKTVVYEARDLDWKGPTSAVIIAVHDPSLLVGVKSSAHTYGKEGAM